MFQISSWDGLWVKMINYKVQYWTGQFRHTVLDCNCAVSCRLQTRLLFNLNSNARPRLIHIHRACLDCTLTVASRIASTVISQGHSTVQSQSRPAGVKWYGVMHGRYLGCLLATWSAPQKFGFFRVQCKFSRKGYGPKKKKQHSWS